MSILAKVDRAALESACRALGDLPRAHCLRPPETGLVMVRGRMGGSGGKFNLGEVAVTRCAVRLDGGTVGHRLGGRAAMRVTPNSRRDWTRCYRHRACRRCRRKFTRK